MKHKVSELEGTLLDAAVALADGRLVVADEPRWPKGHYADLREEYGGRHVVRWYSGSGKLGGWEPLDNQGSPSTDWSIGGPIIERARLTLVPFDNIAWEAFLPASVASVRGPTPLVAAMRAFVMAKLGEEVELP